VIGFKIVFWNFKVDVLVLNGLTEVLCKLSNTVQKTQWSTTYSRHCCHHNFCCKTRTKSMTHPRNAICLHIVQRNTVLIYIHVLTLAGLNLYRPWYYCLMRQVSINSEYIWPSKGYLLQTSPTLFSSLFSFLFWQIQWYALDVLVAKRRLSHLRS
jgi:hypothetical protein